MKKFFLFTLLCVGLRLSAQMPMFQRLPVKASANDRDLPMAMAGGLNSPQFSAADLNGDKRMDLVTFDRAGDVVLTFLNRGTPGQVDYVYAPEYACHFPPLNDWALLRDFNRDGAMDIFAASPQSIGRQEVIVYQGFFQDNILKFKPFKFAYPGCTNCDARYIWYPTNDPRLFNNLQVANTDIPDINDVDGDGDLDILTFESSAGGYVWFIQNRSVELGFGTDSLRFRLADRCWGRFYESGLLPCICDLSAAPERCVKELTDGGATDRAHPGSTVLTYDHDGDGDTELLLGDVSFNCLNLLFNDGSRQQPWMARQDTAFPSGNVPVNITVFPAAFHLDVNNDNRPDMLVAPNAKTIGEDRDGSWFYQNTAAKGVRLELKNKSFLVDQMLDFGSASHPALADVNGDGLTDIVVGNAGFFEKGNPFNARLFLLLNTGTRTAPRFTLSDQDWLGMSEFAPNEYDFHPTFGDLDRDGDLDLLVGANGGGLFYYRNAAGPGRPMQLDRDGDPMWLSMDVGLASSPLIYDLDADGRMDVVAGERRGTLNFFKNIGSPTEPRFRELPDLEEVGRVNTIQVSSIGFSTPALLPTNEGNWLVTGGQSGQLQAHRQIGPSNAPFPVVSLEWGNVDDGERSSPAFADLNDDGLIDLVTGNLRGGLSVYRTELAVCKPPVSAVRTPEATALRVFPNPAQSWVQVQMPVNQAVSWRVFDVLGHIVAEGTAASGTVYLQTEDWNPGIYVVAMSDGRQHAMGRVMITN